MIINDQLLVILIMFLFLYLVEDSFMFLFFMFVLSLILVSFALTSITLATATEDDVKYLFLKIILMTYSVVMMYNWATRFNFDGTEKVKERGL